MNIHDSQNAGMKTFDFNQLVDLCRQTHEGMQQSAARAVDKSLAGRNWLFGWYIVEYEQKGADRAEYGKRLIERLSKRLAPLGIRGVSSTRLKLYRSFFTQYSAFPSSTPPAAAPWPPNGPPPGSPGTSPTGGSNRTAKPAY